MAGRTDLLHFALEGDLGQRAQLRQGMLGDGLWFEGSMSYHFYSVWAILMSALACRHDAGTDISSQVEVRKSLLAPIQCAYPDGTLPATNDCWYFTSILGETLPPVAESDRTSINLPDSGLAILRPAEGVDLLLKYGPHGGGHGHPDKLSLTGWADGWRFSPDLGTPGYGVASLETWYRQTLSHNTVLLDGESQPAAHGRLKRFDPNAVVAGVEWEGVKLRRVVQARPEYFIDGFEVECAAPRRIDWIYHNAGGLSCDAPGQPVPAIQGGVAYQHLGGISERTTAGLLWVHWRDGSFGLTLWMPGSVGEQVFTGLSPANPPTTQSGFVLRRRHGSRAVFVAVFHPFRKTSSVQRVEFLEDGGLLVEVAGRTDRWTAEQLASGGDTDGQ